MKIELESKTVLILTHIFRLCKYFFEDFSTFLDFFRIFWFFANKSSQFTILCIFRTLTENLRNIYINSRYCYTEIHY